MNIYNTFRHLLFALIMTTKKVVWIYFHWILLHMTIQFYPHAHVFLIVWFLAKEMLAMSFISICFESNYFDAHSGATVILSLHLHYFFSLSIASPLFSYLSLSFCLMPHGKVRKFVWYIIDSIFCNANSTAYCCQRRLIFFLAVFLFPWKYFLSYSALTHSTLFCL